MIDTGAIGQSATQFTSLERELHQCFLYCINWIFFDVVILASSTSHSGACCRIVQCCWCCMCRSFVFGDDLCPRCFSRVCRWQRGFLKTYLTFGSEGLANTGWGAERAP